MQVQPLRVASHAAYVSSFGFSQIDGGVCAAKGISASGISAGLRRNPARLDLALVASDKTAVCAATYTQNRFCAAPVQLSREHSKQGYARAIILNSGNANAATGTEGLKTAQQTAELVAQALACDTKEVLVASTGVIGVPLGIEKFRTGVPAAVEALDSTVQAAHNAACAVMTTDTHPKEIAFECVLPADKDGKAPRVVHVGGFVKGSGMIQPNMATMLAVLTTDAPLTVAAAQSALSDAVSQSFNKVTVDSDSSTNDSCFLLATAATKGEPIEVGSAEYTIVAAAIYEVCEHLAREIAKDGEGATKLITVDVLGAASQEDADTVARSIANSPLVKTAIFGHDANWGRVCAAAGKCGVSFDQQNVDVDFLGIPVLRSGLPIAFDEAQMLKLFEDDEISIAVSLGNGSYTSRVWTCDLSYEYVRINGEYRT